MILAAQQIRERGDLITPFYEQARSYGMTYGLGPCGYDIRVCFDAEHEKEHRLLLPGHFLLAASMERVKIPPDLVATVHDKSTWARQGLAVQNTVLEPNWEGYVTLELTNHSATSIHLSLGMPIAQIMFTQLTSSTDRPYEGKYQNQQAGPIPAILEEN